MNKICCATLQWLATANLGIVYEMPGGHVSFVAKLVWRNTGLDKGTGCGETDAWHGYFDVDCGRGAGFEAC